MFFFCIWYVRVIIIIMVRSWCKSSAVKSWTFIGHHWLTAFYFFRCFLCVNTCTLSNSNNMYCHNRIRDTVFELCQRACLGAQHEAGSSLGHEERQTDRLISSSLTGSWDNLLQLTFPSHTRFVMKIFKLRV